MLNLVNPSAMAEKTWKILLFLTASPESAKEMVAALLLGYLIVSIVLAKSHSLGGTGSGSILIGLIVTAFGVFGLIEAAVLGEMLLLPLMAKHLQIFGYYGCIIVGFFLLLIPMTRTFFRATYGTSFMAWITAGLVGAGVMMGVDYYYSENEKSAPTPEAVQEYIVETSRDLTNQGKELLNKKKKDGGATKNVPNPPQ